MRAVLPGAPPSPAPRGGSGDRDPAGTLRTLRRRVVGGIVVVDALAVLVAVAAARTEAVRLADLPVLGLLVLGTVVHHEVARAVSRRAVLADVPGRIPVRLTAMWPFAAVLLLPLGLALVLVVADAGWGALRDPRALPPYRSVFSAASVVLATTAAWSLLRLAPGEDLLGGGGGARALGEVALAVVVRWAVALGLVAGLVAATSPRASWGRLVRPVDALLGLGGLGLGVVLAAVGTTRPWLAVFVLVPLVTMQHGLLHGPLAQAARTDDKTGIADAGHWRRRAARAVDRATATGPVAVLMVDLDHFKAVNDTRGHLVGDRALRAVAQALTGAVRPGDLVGRFGGEEFAVLLTATDAAGAAATAERLRCAVRALVVEVPPEPGRGPVRGLSVSIGVAAHPASGGDLDALLVAADAACYRAKRAGRDRVRTAVAGDRPGA